MLPNLCDLASLTFSFLVIAKVTFATWDNLSLVGKSAVFHLVG